MDIIASGTLTVTGSGVEISVEPARAPATPTAYVYEIDCSAVATTGNGETVFIRVYTVVLASGTERKAYFGSYIGGMDEDPIQLTVPIPVDAGTGIAIRCTVQQKNGTNRSYPWKLYAWS